jgi:hypothetical protein
VVGELRIAFRGTVYAVGLVRRHLLHLAMLLVYEESADDSWAAVHVLVIAPCREVDIPVVQLQWDVTGCMSEIPAYFYTQRLAVPCYELDVEGLSRVELYAREKDERGCRGVMGDDGEYVFV